VLPVQLHVGDCLEPAGARSQEPKAYALQQAGNDFHWNAWVFLNCFSLHRWVMYSIHMNGDKTIAITIVASLFPTASTFAIIAYQDNLLGRYLNQSLYPYELVPCWLPAGICTDHDHIGNIMYVETRFYIN
jgi:hypothetical protein